MTKYYLQGNIDGDYFKMDSPLDSIDLMNQDSIMLSDISNINVSTSESYLQQEFSFHFAKKTMASSVITGTLYFMNGLSYCYSFIHQVAQALDYLGYVYLKIVKDDSKVGISTHYCRVYPKFTSDISIVGNHVATVKVSFQKLSPWFSTPIKVTQTTFTLDSGDMTPFFIATKTFGNNTTTTDTFWFKLTDTDTSEIVGNTKYTFKSKDTGAFKFMRSVVIIDNGWDSACMQSSLFVGLIAANIKFNQTIITPQYKNYVPLNLSMKYGKTYSWFVSDGYSLYICYRSSNV